MYLTSGKLPYTGIAPNFDEWLGELIEDAHTPNDYGEVIAIREDVAGRFLKYESDAVYERLEFYKIA